MNSAITFALLACVAGSMIMMTPRLSFASDEQSVASSEDLAVATFAGGCFWCMEKPFDQIDGVIKTTSGYTGGHLDNPTYKQVSSGITGHTEAIQITYNPKKVTYSQLLDVFWVNIDPLDSRGQFCDKGTQYRSGIFYHDEEQKRLAEESRQRIDASSTFSSPVVTEITPASTFWPAEEYHQNYYEKNPIRYNYYRYGCGRDKRLEELWGNHK